MFDYGEDYEHANTASALNSFVTECYEKGVRLGRSARCRATDGFNHYYV